MNRQFINTPGVSETAHRIRTVNSNIDNAFRTLRNRMQQLENWRGAAGAVAQTTMHQLFRMGEARSAVLQNYVSMLEKQVNPGYKGAETTNTSLADKFK